MHGQDAKAALVSQADRQDFGVDLDLIAVKGWAPIDVLGAQHDRLFIRPVLQNCHVNRLVELQKHRRVELDLLVIPNELKHERLVEDGVARSRHDLRTVTILQEGNCHRELLVWPHIDEVDESVASNDRAAHVALVRVELLVAHHAALAGHDRR